MTDEAPIKGKALWKGLAELVLVFAMVSFLFWLLFGPSMERFEPPSSNATLAEFADVMPAPRGVYVD